MIAARCERNVAKRCVQLINAVAHADVCWSLNQQHLRLFFSPRAPLYVHADWQLKLHRAALASRLLIPTQTLIVTLSLTQNKTMSHQENRLVTVVEMTSCFCLAAAGKPRLLWTKQFGEDRVGGILTWWGEERAQEREREENSQRDLTTHGKWTFSPFILCANNFSAESYRIYFYAELANKRGAAAIKKLKYFL